MIVGVCSHCGAIAGTAAHGHRDAPEWRWLQVEYVPRSELDALREAVRAFLHGAPLDEHGRFKDARLEPLYRATVGDRMTVIEHNGPWHIFVCPGCGRNVHGPRHRCDVPDPGLSERVEVVRADQLTGAVSERDFWRRRAVDLGAKADEYEAGSAVVREYVEARDQLRGQRG